MNINNFRNQDKYNLFVTSSRDAWETDSYIMPIDRCLTSYTTAEIKAEYGLLDDVAVGKLKMYPCIFAYEDSDSKQDAYVGYLTDVVVRKTGVKFYYKKINVLSYDDFHKMTFELDINMSGGITELMHTHWTIKNVKLLSELDKILGITSVPIRPTIFISYCWTPKEVKERVLQLAERLEEDGVNVLYDKKSLRPGQDMNAFMESLATNPQIKKVLVICTNEYARKADARLGGVGTEAEIIIPQVYGKPMQNKIIPIFFEKDNQGRPICPVYLKSRLGIDLTNMEEGYEELLEDIFR